MRTRNHPKINELRSKAMPITLSGSYVDKDGNLQQYDFKIAVADIDRGVKGYLAVWGNIDYHGEVLIKGAFAKSIAERGPASASKQKIAFLWMHDCCDPIGQFTVLKEDNYGLYFEATLDNVPSGDRALEQIKSGTLNQFSVGFNYIWDRVEYDEQMDAIIIMEGVLMEGSVVTMAANQETYAIKGAQEITDLKVALMDKTEDYIRTIPREKQLELRQLISEHITLAQVKSPEPKKQKAFNLSLPEEVPLNVGMYKINLKQFSL